MAGLPSRLLVVSLCGWAAAAEAGPPLRPHAVAGDAEEVPLVRLRPSTIVLGTTEAVTFEIEASEREGDPPLRASVNVGSLGAIEQVEPGSYRARYNPPQQRFPQVAVIALWRETGPDATVAFYRIPLLGTARVPVQTAPGAQIAVSVAGRNYGPFEADEDGRVAPRVIVPPGVRHATVMAATEDGEETSQRLDLGVPPYNRLTLAAVPHALTADGVSPLRLHLYYDDTGRRPPPAAHMRVQTELDERSPLRHGGGPLYAAEYTAPLGMPDREVEFRASVRRDRASSARASASVGKQRVARLRAQAVHPSHVADGTSALELDLSVRDEMGLGISGSSLDLDASPAELVESYEILDLGGGEYRVRIEPARIDTPSDGRFVELTFEAGEVTEHVTIELLPWLPAELLVEPESLRLVADGSSIATMKVRVKDEDGRSMDHLPPVASASLGRVLSVLDAEGGGFLVEYQAPRWERRPERDAPDQAPVRNESIRFGAGEAGLELPVVLEAIPRRPFEVEPYLRAGLGMQSNLGALAGPVLMIHAEVPLAEHGPVVFSGGLWTGFSYLRGGWDLGATSARASAGIYTIPLLLAASAGVDHLEWSGGAALGAGLMMAPGGVRIDGADQVAVGAVAPAAGVQGTLGRRAGPGTVGLTVAYLLASRRGHRGVTDVTGSVGGLSLVVGYGVGL